jgi:acetoin utilization deacetylase AcuC-like enzyme
MKRKSTDSLVGKIKDEFARAEKLLEQKKYNESADAFLKYAANYKNDLQTDEWLNAFYMAASALNETSLSQAARECLELSVIRIRDGYSTEAAQEETDDLLHEIRQKYDNNVTNAKTGFSAPKDCERHLNVAGYQHAHEKPERIETIRDTIEDEFKANYKPISEEMNEAQYRNAITRAHTKNYRIQMQKTIEDIEAKKTNTITKLSTDNLLSQGSGAAMAAAVVAPLNGLQAILDGDITNGFVAVRPPGHHANAADYCGFCFLGNVGITALEAIQQKKRVLIVDIDAHHGNGTLDILTETAKNSGLPLGQYVQFLDLFAENSFVTPERLSTGQQQFAQCISLDPGTEIKDYMQALETGLSNVTERGFIPDLIIVSAGFDGHKNDELIGLQLNSKDYSQISQRICGYADRFCQGRALFVLEGGYDLEALSESVKCTFEQLRVSATLQHAHCNDRRVNAVSDATLQIEKPLKSGVKKRKI